MPALTLCIAAVTIGLGTGAAQATPVAPPQYHAATVLVADGGRVWATDSAVYRVDPPASFRLPHPERGPGPTDLLVAPDGKTLCVRRPYEAYILNARTLRLVRRLDTPNVWWGRPGWRWIEAEAELNGATVLAVDIETGYALADRVVAEATEARGSCEIRRLSVVRCLGPRTLQEVVPLVDAAYDPGSTGSPTHFRAGAPGLAVFGYPHNGDDGLDAVGAYWNGRLRAPVRDSAGHKLVFAAQPLRAGGDVVGLAVAIHEHVEALEGCPRYLFRLSRTGITLTPMTSDVVLVTYDERQRRLGLGHRRPGYVELQWHE